MASTIPGESKPRQPFLKMLWKEWIKPVGSVLLVMVVVRSSVMDWNDVPSGSMLPTIQLGDRVVVNKLAYGAQFPLSGPYIEIPFTSTRFRNPIGGLGMIRWGGPKRGDIITFWSPNPDPDQNGIRLIKRVVAVPGDTLEVKDGVVWLNGKPTSYMDIPGREPVRETHRSPATRAPQSYALRHGIEQAAESPAHAVQFIDELYSLRHMAPVTLGEDQYFCMGDDRDDSADSRVWAAKGVFIARRQITGKAVGIAWNYRDGSLGRFFKSLYPTVSPAEDAK